MNTNKQKKSNSIHTIFFKNIRHIHSRDISSSYLLFFVLNSSLLFSFKTLLFVCLLHNSGWHLKQFAFYLNGSKVEPHHFESKTASSWINAWTRTHPALFNCTMLWFWLNLIFGNHTHKTTIVKCRCQTLSKFKRWVLFRWIKENNYQQIGWRTRTKAPHYQSQLHTDYLHFKLPYFSSQHVHQSIQFRPNCPR